MDTSNKISFLSADLKLDPTTNKREPLDIALDSDELEEQLSVFYRFTNKILDMDNLVILAGSGTSLTFNKRGRPTIAPSMWNLWDDCQKADNELFNLTLKATKYSVLQKEKDGAGNEKPDIELLLSLCDSALAVGNLSNTRTNQVTRGC
jgi:hypothetical protein